MAAPVDPALIEDIVVANRVLVNEGVLDAYGHVSVRHPKNPGRYLLGRNLAPALVTASDIVEYDLDSIPMEAPASFTHFHERFIDG
jgi:HCOMODA/2-hydroxy-3-carboxy-muconic semialdehyde decarboxylase